MTRFAALNDFWSALAARERSAITLAALVVAAMLTWWLALAPPLKTLAQADAQR